MSDPPDLDPKTPGDPEHPTGRLARVEQLFHEVLATPADARLALLRDRSGADTELFRQVQSLLRAFEREASTSGARRQLQAAQDDAVLHQRIGTYELESLLGRGGMGAVYLAHRADGQYEKKVAIKLIDLPLATDLFRDRFRQERQILAGLEHPLIARLLDGGVSDQGALYLVMEFVDGRPIDQFCREAALSIPQRLTLFLSVCNAVQYAHQKLVVHRDLKPDNILVSPDGTPHLLDFGTAKLLSDSAVPATSLTTREGFLSFTPQYASPEQVLGRPISVATDIYSLGVLLYLLLTGELPYKLSSLSTEELIDVICHQQPRTPSSIAPPTAKLDADIDSILLKALRKEPEDRYATIEHFAADIQAWLDRKPVLARRGNLRYRSSKFIRRHTLALSAAAVLALTATAGIAGILWQSHRANIERRRAIERSEDLRQLSTSLLSEINDAITSLPGSTPVQHLLVNRVIEHLDRMGKEAANDPQTQVDMIVAYTKLANVQGDPYYQNIGDPKAALQSLDKALAFATTLHAADSNSPDVLQAFAREQKVRSEVLFALGREDEEEAVLQTALHAFDRRLHLIHPTIDDLAETSASYNTLGDQRNRRALDDPADPQSSTAAYRQQLALSEQIAHLQPNSERALRGLAFSHLKYGSGLAILDPDAAVKEERLALQALDALPEPTRSSKGQRTTRAWIDRELAIGLWQGCHLQQAIDTFEDARLVQEPLVESDPKNASAIYWLSEFLSLQGEVHIAMLNPSLNPDRSSDAYHARRALELDRKALALSDHLVTLAPDNFFWLALDAANKVRVGTLQQVTPQAHEGATLAAQGIAILRKSASKPDNQMLTLDAAVQSYLAVQPASLRDPAWTLDAAQSLVDRSHHRSPIYFVMLARAANGANAPDRARAAANEGLACLKPVGSSTNPLLNQRLLNAELQRANQHP